jgi:4-hydroxy-tetrahydrodipicolinate reductase
VDVVIDFSRPEALSSVLTFAKNAQAAAVIGTTGMTEENFAMIEEYSHHIPILQAANLSLGLNLMLQLVEKTAGFLGNDFDVEIIEKHHTRKVDAPSGTALVIADTINKAQGNGKYYVFGRHTQNERRDKKEIGIHAIRGGTLAGTHEVGFYGPGETLTIIHDAQNRTVFAQGAIAAAAFLKDKPAGYYAMDDLIKQMTI